MKATKHIWDSAPHDEPIPLLSRNMIKGEQALVARVHLAQGCDVASHSHPSEQIAVQLSGRTLWTLGQEGTPDRYTEEMVGAQVMHLPSGVYHEVNALEDSLIIDVLSPVGPMGVDTQSKQ